MKTVTGAEAWDMLQQSDTPRMVILDWMMSEMDGSEITRRASALQQPNRPPYIIMLTTKGGSPTLSPGLMPEPTTT